MRKITFETTWGVHGLFLIIGLLLIYTNPMELHFDEAQYWYWSKRPQLAYYSKPGLIAYANFISTWIFGDTHFGVRLPAVLSSIGTSIFLGLIAKRVLNDPKMTLFTVLTYYLSPIFLYTSIIFSTDSLLLFFWAGAMYFFWRAFQENKIQFWILAGTMNMAGIMSKYTMFLFPVFSVFYILFSKKEILKSKGFLLYLTISLLGWFPILLWNFQNDFVSFKHVGTLAAIGEDRVTPLSKRLGNVFEFLGGQLAIIGPLFLLLYFKAFRFLKNCCATRKVFVYLLLPSIMVFIYFLGLSIFRHSGANVNWTIFSLISFPIIMAYFVVRKKRFNMFFISMSITVVLELFAFDMIYRGGNSFVNSAFPKINFMQRYIGWQELTAELEEDVRNLGIEKTIVITNSYHVASNLKFYAQNKFPVVFVTTGGRMNQYDLWNEVKPFENKEYNIVFIARGKPSFDLSAYTEEMVESKSFQVKVRELDTKKYHIESHAGFQSLPFSSGHF